MTEARYNGWTNHATWAVALHLSNDQGTQEMVEEWAEQALSDAENDREDAALRLLEQIKDFVEEELEAAQEAAGQGWGALLLRDLVEDGVNWFEIAESYCSEAVTA